MHDILDLETYPLHKQYEPEGIALVERCQAELARNGMFNLPGLMLPDALECSVAEVLPELERNAYTHTQLHNIYFKKHVEGVDPDHPALKLSRTSNRKICGDQMQGFILKDLYEWEPFAAFLAKVMEKPALYCMADQLAGINVMTYREGETLNWHFDRSEFTTTLLIQAPDAGGEFEYRSGLRTPEDPNYVGVARLLAGEDDDVRTVALSAGTLNVFRGVNTAHRVTPVIGPNDRTIAVLSYYETPDVNFSEEDRIKFYGRAA